MLKYSLLVPCYNAEKYIEGFLANFAKLSRPFHEVIFYDDASTDQTVNLLKSKGYSPIEGKMNKGPGYARNRLAEAAHGDYIHFHDIDDEISSDFLELVQDKILQEEAEVIIGDAEWIDAVTRRSVISWQYQQVEINKDPISYFLTHPLGIINTLYKKDTFIQLNGFDENIHCWEDADLHVRLAMLGVRFSVINSNLAYSIRHNNGISKNQSWCWCCRICFLEKYRLEMNAKYNIALGQEFEKAANELFSFNEFSNAFRSFRSSRNCGLDAPTTSNRQLVFIKRLSPVLSFLIKGVLIKISKLK